MCVCTRGYQTSHARAITNVGRSQLHRFIAVTADLRVAVIKTKKKRRGGRREDRNNGTGYRKDGDYRRLNEKPDTLRDFQRQWPRPLLSRVGSRGFFAVNFSTSLLERRILSSCLLEASPASLRESTASGS